MVTACVLVLGTLLVGMEAAHQATAQSATPIIRAAFYYPWFPGAWTQNGIYPYTKYTPSNGYYSSNNAALVKQQIAAMQYGHLDARDHLLVGTASQSRGQRGAHRSGRSGWNRVQVVLVLRTGGYR